MPGFGHCHGTGTCMNKIQNKTWPLGLLVTTIIGFFLINKVSEYDIWFHLTMGKEIIRSGAVLVKDSFSLLNLGRPYHDSQWLFQVLMAAGYGVAGFWWLQMAQVAAWGGTLLCMFKTCRTWASANAAWVTVLVVALACADRFIVRPELVTVLMLSLFYWLLQQSRCRSWREMALLALLQVIWANSHGVFVIGPFLVGCYLVEALLQKWQGRKDVYVRELGILLGVVLAAGLLTPHGLEGFRFAWLLMMEASPAASKLFEHVYELKSPFAADSRGTLVFWCYFALLAGWVVTLAGVLWSCRKHLPLARTLIAAGMLALSLAGIRNIPLFALVAAPLTVECMSLLQPALRRRLVAAVAAVLAIAMLLWPLRPAFDQLANWYPYRFGVGLSRDYVPLGLPRFLDQLNFSGPVYNTQSLGGFYEFHGYPRRVPFFDGRFEAYEPNALLAVYEAATSASADPARWNALLQKHGFRALLLENGSNDATGLLPVISKNGQWRLVYLDHAASFWLRDDYPSPPQEIGEADVALLVDQVASYANMENLFLFLEKTGLYPELRIKLIEQGGQRWVSDLILVNLGLQQLQAGAVERAEQTFKHLLGRSPRSQTTLATLAQIALARGNAPAAEKYLLLGLKYYPNDANLRENLETVRRTMAK